MDSGAVFSPCRRWRYVLWRTWAPDAGHVAVIGLNPSTADEFLDDNTVRRCIRFARRWGYGGLYMLNLFGFRATDPEVMKAADDPVGSENDTVILEYHALAGLTVAAWGVHGGFHGRDAHVLGLLHGRRKLGSDLWCLGVTKDGYPKHPLYLKQTELPREYFGRSVEGRERQPLARVLRFEDRQRSLFDREVIS